MIAWASGCIGASITRTLFNVKVTSVCSFFFRDLGDLVGGLGEANLNAKTMPNST